MIYRGGKAVYGAPLGILMLEAKFARIPGDMGNAVTWPFPVLYQVVPGASPERVVLEGAQGLLPDFLLDRIGRSVALGLQDVGHAGRVVGVHLAAVGFDVGLLQRAPSRANPLEPRAHPAGRPARGL